MRQYSIVMGCDPEFFFTKDGKIIGAEEVLPKDGMNVASHNASKIIIDGVQAELNPAPSSCRQLLGAEISKCFMALKTDLDKKGVSTNFSQTVEVAKDEFDKLSDKSKRFGCSPSKNVHKKKSSAKITVDPMKYRKRSAGGHLHLGKAGGTMNKNSDAVLDDPKRLVPILDIIVGNTCVLLDRDEGNIERRKTYGRAGEHRTPEHGIEYRTLSNFWLRDYALMSFVFGLARFAVSVCAENLDSKFKKAIKIKDIEKAINENDFDLAYKNFLKIQPIIEEITQERGVDGYSFPLTKSNIPRFNHVVKRGLDYWFKNDPIQSWLSIGGDWSEGIGWERFLDETVARDLKENV